MVWHETTIFRISVVSKGNVLWAELVTVYYFGQPQKNINSMVWHKTTISEFSWLLKESTLGRTGQYTLFWAAGQEQK